MFSSSPLCIVEEDSNALFKKVGISLKRQKKAKYHSKTNPMMYESFVEKTIITAYIKQ